MRFISCLLPLAMLSTAGCARYERRPVELHAMSEDLIRRELDAEVIATAVARMDRADWFARVRPSLNYADGLDVDEAFLTALVHNPKLRELRAELGEWQGGVTAASALMNPDADFMAVGNGGEWMYESMVKTELLSLLNIAKRPARVGAAQAEYDRAKLRLRLAEWDVYVRLHRAFELYWHHSAILDTFREIAARLENEIAAPAGEAARLGALPRASLAAIQRLRNAWTLELERMTQDIAVEREVVNELIGMPPERVLELARHGGEPGCELTPADLDRLWNFALRERIDLQETLAAYDVSEHRLRLAVLEQYPDIGIGPRAEWDSLESFFGGAVSVKLPLFYRNQGEIAMAEARRDAERARVEGVLYSIRDDLFHALRDAKFWSGRVERIGESIVKPASVSLEAAVQLARLDPVMWMRAVDAFEMWADAVNEQAVAESKCIEVRIAVEQAVGAPLREIGVE